jgi:hypothetical protein
LKLSLNVCSTAMWVLCPHLKFPLELEFSILLCCELEQSTNCLGTCLFSWLFLKLVQSTYQSNSCCGVKQGCPSCVKVLFLCSGYLFYVVEGFLCFVTRFMCPLAIFYAPWARFLCPFSPFPGWCLVFATWWSDSKFHEF